MTNSTKRTYTRNRKPCVRKLENGLTLRAEVSPCVFMYSGYPLQIQVTLHRRDSESLGEAYLTDSTKTATTYSDADVRRLLRRVCVTTCSRCSTPAFDLATIKTNRRGLCEPCFTKDIQTEWAAMEKVEREKTLARDRRMKQKGMVVRVNAWVHPEDGDDYEVEWYLNRHPIAEEVALLLLNEGSTCLHDYAIAAL
jgi:hypothetical protein